MNTSQLRRNERFRIAVRACQSTNRGTSDFDPKQTLTLIPEFDFRGRAAQQ